MSCGTVPAQLVMKAREIPEINGGFMGKIVIFFVFAGYFYIGFISFYWLFLNWIY
jgi:hypothetical protein